MQTQLKEQIDFLPFEPDFADAIKPPPKTGENEPKIVAGENRVFQFRQKGTDPISAMNQVGGGDG